ncbi:MAG: hypothetical protein OWU84_11535 [Firmicutes bacterium]|nr:hypothetical protein [Bacillota bacterium]
MRDDKSLEIEAVLLQALDQEVMDDETFNRLALTLFEYQFERNAPFQAFCRRRHRTPATVSAWHEIPPVPVQAFKHPGFWCEPPERCATFFQTSGTTDPARHGRHYHPNLTVWERSMSRQFRRWVLPHRDRIRMVVMNPTDAEWPHSSLAHYMTVALDHFGDAASASVWREGTLEWEALEAHLVRAAQDGAALCLMGATFAYVHAFDRWASRGRRFCLPEGSIILDTGGTKGRSRDISRREFEDALVAHFGLTPSSWINMFGMTELSSQFYSVPDSRSPDYDAPLAYVSPPWVRTLVLDPVSLTPLSPGQQGVLAHYDLANRNAAVGILTEDWGVKTEAGFQFLGRRRGAELRGCSLAIDEYLQGVPSRGI